MALVLAHVDLAKAEAAAIAGQVGQVAALGAMAVVLVIFAVFLLVIGVSLGLGEWLLGSMGWGVIDGVLAFLAVAMAAVLLAVGVSAARIGRAFLAAVLLGIVIGVVLGLSLPNQLYAAIGETTGLAVDPGIRPLAVALAIWAIVGALVGLGIGYRLHQVGGSVAFLILLGVGIAAGAGLATRVLPDVGNGLVVIVWAVTGALVGILVALSAMRAERPLVRVGWVAGLLVGGAIVGAISTVLIATWIGTVAGVLVAAIAIGIAVATAVHGRDGALATLGSLVAAMAFGAFTAITFIPQVGAGIGITAGYIIWMALMGMDIARTGIDVEALKARFYPGQTIDTSKETLEWLQKRMPPGIGS